MQRVICEDRDNAENGINKGGWSWTQHLHRKQRVDNEIKEWLEYDGGIRRVCNRVKEKETEVIWVRVPWFQCLVPLCPVSPCASAASIHEWIILSTATCHAHYHYHHIKPQRNHSHLRNNTVRGPLSPIILRCILIKLTATL